MVVGVSHLPGMLCLLEAMVCSGPEISLVFPYGPSSKEKRETELNLSIFKFILEQLKLQYFDCDKAKMILP